MRAEHPRGDGEGEDEDEKDAGELGEHAPLLPDSSRRGKRGRTVAAGDPLVNKIGHTAGVPTPVAVLGGGSFGTCLAVLSARQHDVVLWARDGEVVEGIRREHRNPRYLRDIPLPPSCGPPATSTRRCAAGSS